MMKIERLSMVILEFYQNNYSKYIVAFDSIKDGKIFVAQIPGYTLETEDGFEVEFFNPTNLPDYAGSKVFTGRVVNGTHDLIGIGLPFDYPIWISEVVEFIAEWRCFVLDGRVLDVRPYTGDYHAQFDPSVIDKAISCWKDAPIAYGLDIGVTSDGRTLVVEVNDGYALGNYGLSPLNSINFHKARWKEMVKPYFEKNDVFNMPENENISL